MTPISIKTINSRTRRRIDALATLANGCCDRLDSYHLDILKKFAKEIKTTPTVYRTNEDSYRSVLRFDLGNGHYIQGAFSPADGWSWQSVFLPLELQPEFFEDFYQVVFLSLLVTWMLDNLF